MDGIGAAPHFENGALPHAQWRVQLFGALTAIHPDRTIRSFRTGKTSQLLAFVACRHPAPQPRERLIELLWPDAEPEDGRNSLRVAVSSLRRQLEPPGTPTGSVLGGDRSMLGLSPDRVSVDVVDFRSAIRAAQRLENPADRITHLLSAEALYRSELLPSFYDDWVLEERRECEEAMFGVLRQLAADLAAIGDFERALVAAQRLAALDPLDENAHASLIKILLALNRTGEARDRYKALERSLRTHLGSAPLPETQALVAGLPRVLPRSRRLDIDKARSKRLDSGEPAEEDASGTIQRTALPTTGTGRERPSLPPTFTRFIGREREVAKLLELFCDVAPTMKANNTSFRVSTESADARGPLVTLAGPGGVGKTRLAIEAGRAIAVQLHGPVVFVPLAEVMDAEQLPLAVSRAVGLETAAVAAMWDQLGSALRGRQALLILDNLEQLGELGAQAVHNLRTHLPDTRMLVTSRVLLELEGEIELVVEALATPTEPASPEVLMTYPSVRLFVDRAQAARQDFQLTPGSAADVANICDQLSGLPLALELAAGWARSLSPAQMHARLRSTLDLLVSRRRDLPERHRSMRAAVEASCQLLSEAEYEIFRQLSVFHGGFCQDAATAVCGPDATLGALDHLRASSLLVVEREGSELRWSMLPILRALAVELVPPEVLAVMKYRHAVWARDLVEISAQMLCGPDQIAWSRRLEAERMNVLAAIDWCAASGDLNSELRIAAALCRFWRLRGPFHEGIERLRSALNRPGDAESRVRAAALEAAGQLAMRDGGSRQAKLWLDESLTLRRAAGDLQGTASTLTGLAWLAYESDDYESSEGRYLEALSLSRQISDRHVEATCLNGLAVIAYATGDVEQSRQWHSDVLAIARELCDVSAVAASLSNIADCLHGDLPSAEALYAESLVLQRQLGNKNGAAVALFNLAECARKRGEHDRARELHCDGLKLKRDLGRRSGIAYSFEALAGLAVDREEYRRAATLLGAASFLRDVIGIPAPEPHRSAVSTWRERCRICLGTAFNAVIQAGETLTLADSVRFALER